MKKIFYIIIAALISSVTAGTTFAGSTITVLNPSHKTSPAAVFATAFRDSIDANYYQAADCVDAGRKYNRTKNAVFIYNSSMDFAGRNKGLNCNLEPLTNKKIVFVGNHYFKICRLPGTKYDFGSERTTMGIASMLATQSHEDTFKAQGVNLKIVPFSGSKTVLRALLAGDINLGWMGQGIAATGGDRIECLYSTNPEAADFLGNTVKVPVPDFHISYVVYTNSTDPVILKKLHNVENSKIFERYLEKSMTTGTFNITDKSSRDAIDYVNRMYINWADK